ncbi:hypothetical protein [Streptomyces sp. SLBN-31]
MVTAWALGVVAVLAVVQAFDPALIPGGDAYRRWRRRDGLGADAAGRVPG